MRYNNITHVKSLPEFGWVLFRQIKYGWNPHSLSLGRSIKATGSSRVVDVLNPCGDGGLPKA